MWLWIFPSLICVHNMFCTNSSALLLAIALSYNMSASCFFVHGHSAFSTLAHEALFVGSILGLGTVFTDHSLFGFADASAIVTNTFLKFSLANIDHCICVSHTGKENTGMYSSLIFRAIQYKLYCGILDSGIKLDFGIHLLMTGIFIT